MGLVFWLFGKAGEVRLLCVSCQPKRISGVLSAPAEAKAHPPTATGTVHEALLLLIPEPHPRQCSNAPTRRIDERVRRFY